jgi:hypothetical protein
MIEPPRRQGAKENQNQSAAFSSLGALAVQLFS